MEHGYNRIKGGQIPEYNKAAVSTASFYRDQVLMHFSGRVQAAFSPLIVRKPERMIVDTVERHDYTQETLMCLDDDIVLHVAPAGKEPVPELTEAFIVKRGTIVCLNIATWHYSAIPVHNETAHVMIVLPERTYFNDICIVNYAEEDKVEIVL